jgi:hypothetical protein
MKLLFGFTIAAQIALSAVAMAAPKQKLQRPAIVSAKGDELTSFNIELVKSGSSNVYLDFTDTISPVISALGWKVYMIDFKTSDIVWSKSGEGVPPAKLLWDGRTDLGNFVSDGQKLGLKMSITTNEGQLSSEVFEFSVVSRQAFLRKLDVGIHFQPRAGFGFVSGAFDVKNSDIEGREYEIRPIVITDLNFHMNRTHFLGVVLKAGSLIEEKISETTQYTLIRADEYHSNSVHYNYMLINNVFGGRFALATGAQGFQLKVISQELEVSNDGEPAVRKYATQITGSAWTLQCRVRLWETGSIDVGYKHGIGMDAKKGTLQDYSFGASLGVSNNVDFRIVGGLQKATQTTLSGFDIEATTQTIDFFLELLL